MIETETAKKSVQNTEAKKFDILIGIFHSTRVLVLVFDPMENLEVNKNKLSYQIYYMCCIKKKSQTAIKCKIIAVIVKFRIVGFMFSYTVL